MPIMRSNSYGLLAFILVFIAIIVVFPILTTTTTKSVEFGFLKGKVTIGPLCPLEPCNLTPEQMTKTYEARKIIVYTQNRASIVKEIDLDQVAIMKLI